MNFAAWPFAVMPGGARDVLKQATAQPQSMC